MKASHVCREGSWRRLYDARGIYCCRVCDVCEADRRREFRSDIFSDPNYETCEGIEGDFFDMP